MDPDPGDCNYMDPADLVRLRVSIRCIRSSLLFRSSYNEMKNETVKKLSNLVRDKELEITSLQVRSEMGRAVIRGGEGERGDAGKGWWSGIMSSLSPAYWSEIG